MNMIKYLDKIKDLNVLIMGETIIDEYQYGHTLGKSGKAPIVAFKNEHSETYDGGVLAIHSHLKEFCHSKCYSNDDKYFIKKRYVQNGQKLFETYTEKETGANTILGNHFYTNCIAGKDLVIIADFGHGMFDPMTIRNISDYAKYIALNVQMNAGNMGLSTINKYKKRNYICISENELRLAFSNQFDDIRDVIKDNIKDSVVSITRGKEGSIIYKNNKFYEFPALVDKPIDSTGAGDAYLAITSPLAYIGAPAEVIGTIGSIAGAIACSYQGNKEYITKKKLLQFMEKIDG